jgi:hypothetical protein
MREKAYLFKRKGISLWVRRHISLNMPIYPFNLFLLPSLFAIKMAKTTQSTIGMRPETDFSDAWFCAKERKKYRNKRLFPVFEAFEGSNLQNSESYDGLDIARAVWLKYCKSLVGKVLMVDNSSQRFNVSAFQSFFLRVSSFPFYSFYSIYISKYQIVIIVIKETVWCGIYHFFDWNIETLKR